MPEASDDQLAAFGDALKAALIASGVTHEQLAARVTGLLGESVTPASVSNWVNGKNEPTRVRMFAIEQTLDLRPGSLSRHLGYLPVDARPARTVKDLLDEDPKIGPELRAVVLAAYQAARSSR
jgi:transcriptional regulator with XRE-family HTH domain